MNISSLNKLLPFIIFMLISCKSNDNLANRNRENNYVPNKETAIKIAEAIWLPIYGETIYEKKPYVVELIDNKIWRVKGTLKMEEVGGVPIIEIQKIRL